MRTVIGMIIGAVIGAIIIQRLMIEQHEYEKLLYREERIKLLIKLSECNGTIKNHVCYPPYKIIEK